MPIRLLACDLDGTLIGPSDLGLDAAREVALLCEKHSIAFTVATGRAFGAVQRYLNYLDVKSPCITNGGALLATKEGRILSQKHIAKDLAQVIWARLNAVGLPSYSVVGKEIFTEWKGQDTRDYSNALGYDINIVDSCMSLVGKGPTQIVVRCQPEKAEELLNQFRALWSGQVSIKRTLPHLLEFFPLTVSKAAALKKLSKMLNVPRSQVMAIGDGLNDIDMLIWAKEKACVANSHPKLVEIANVVSSEPLAWGVLEILENYLEGNRSRKEE